MGPQQTCQRGRPVKREPNHSIVEVPTLNSEGTDLYLYLISSTFGFQLILKSFVISLMIFLNISTSSGSSSVGNLPPTSALVSTRRKAAFTLRTIVGRSPFSLSFPCIIPLTGSSSFLPTDTHRSMLPVIT